MYKLSKKKSRPLRKIRYTVCTFECSSLLNNVYSNNGGFYEQNGFDKPLKFGKLEEKNIFKQFELFESNHVLYYMRLEDNNASHIITFCCLVSFSSERFLV